MVEVDRGAAGERGRQCLPAAEVEYNKQSSIARQSGTTADKAFLSPVRTFFAKYFFFCIGKQAQHIRSARRVWWRTWVVC